MNYGSSQSDYLAYTKDDTTHGFEWLSWQIMSFSGLAACGHMS